PNSDLCSDICFTDFCSRKSLGFLHVNTRSLLPKIDQLKVWVHSSNPDVLSIRKAKASYFKEQFSLCGSNPKKFWKTIKDLEDKPSSSQLPMSLNVDDVVVTDKEHMAELFNHYFIKSGFLFDSAMPPCPSNISSSPSPSNVTSPDAPPSFSPTPLQSFSLQAVTES
ncbi:unnamed protein product, partial [Coregonus sp. 'balchen']